MARLFDMLKVVGDANLLKTWSSNPHAKIQIPGKPSISCLIGVTQR